MAETLGEALASNQQDDIKGRTQCCGPAPNSLLRIQPYFIAVETQSLYMTVDEWYLIQSKDDSPSYFPIKLSITLFIYFLVFIS